MTPTQSTVRIYSPFLPFPPTDGSAQVIFDQVRALLGLGRRVELVTWNDPPGVVAQKLAAAASRLPVVPKVTSLAAPDEPGAPTRQPHGVPPDLSATGSRGSWLGTAARVARSIPSTLASPELFFYPPGADLRHLLPPAELGIYHYSFAYPWLRRATRRETKVCVHIHNLESDLARLRVRGALRPGGVLHRLNAAKLRAHETALGGLADELWFVSGVDMQRFAEGRSAARLRLVPPTFDVEALPRGEPDPGETHVCVGFLGRCDFEPNRASLQWIVDRLAPELQRRGFRGRVLVAGRNLPTDLEARARRFGFFEWLGFVPSLGAFWNRLSFLLVPHVGGSGIRIKLLEALARGVPVIASAAAIDPLADDLRASPLLVAAPYDPAGWAARIVREAPAFGTRSSEGPASWAGSSLDGRAVYGFLGASGPAQPRRSQERSQV